MLAPLLIALILQNPAPGPTPVPVPIPLPTPDRPGTPIVYPTAVLPSTDSSKGLDIPNSTAHATVTPIAPVEPPPQPDVPDEEVHVRILDLVEIDGVRANQLEGFGLVTGLSGTGDKGNAARQALANYIRRNNVNVANADVDIGNVALVTVTCRRPSILSAGPFRTIPRWKTKSRGPTATRTGVDVDAAPRSSVARAWSI